MKNLTSLMVGFTLVEMMIVISVLSILMSLSVPSFSAMFKRHKASGEADNMVSLIYLARSEAIKNNQVVTICRSENGLECGNDWKNGWLIFVDNNRNGSKDINEKILRSGQAGNGYQLSFRAFGSTRYLRFTPLGITLAQNGTFKLCPEDNDDRYARAVIISKTARARLAKDADGDGIYEAANGSPLSCT